MRKENGFSAKETISAPEGVLTDCNFVSVKKQIKGPKSVLKRSKFARIILVHKNKRFCIKKQIKEPYGSPQTQQFFQV